MTTQAANLPGRIPSGPIRIERPDKTSYYEHDADAVALMVKAGVVEGYGPSSGRIAMLRLIYPESDAMERMRLLREPSVAEPRGSIATGASREIFRERLSDTWWTWCHKRNRNLSARPVGAGRPPESRPRPIAVVPQVIDGAHMSVFHSDLEEFEAVQFRADDVPAPIDLGFIEVI